MVYNIEIAETNCRVETIDAESEMAAITKARAAYENGEIVLTDENSYVNVNFRLV